jgi:hypothetical protein
MIDDGPPRPVAPEAEEAARLKEQARANLAAARKLIAACGYHRRDEELAELEAVLADERRFADLPPRSRPSPPGGGKRAVLPGERRFAT